MLQLGVEVGVGVEWEEEEVKRREVRCRGEQLQYMAVVPGNSGSPGSGNSANQSTMTANQQNNERQGITSRTSHWGRLCHRICAQSKQSKQRKPHKKHCQETRKESLRVTEPEAHANKCVIIGSHNLSSTKQIVHTDPSLALCWISQRKHSPSFLPPSHCFPACLPACAQVLFTFRTSRNYANPA